MSNLSAYAVSDEVAQNLLDDERRVLELVFAGKRLTGARGWMDGESQDIPLPTGSEKIGLEDVPQWPLYQLIESQTPTGSHVGGKPKKGLILPEPDCIAPFQYLGTLTENLAGLEWLPFDLHLVGPVLNGYQQVMFDYRDPLKPKLVNESDSQLDDFDFADEVIAIDKVRHRRLEIREIDLVSVAANNWSFDSGIEGHIGIPNWLQPAALPVHPVSGKAMSFVCEFGFNLFVVSTAVRELSCRTA